MNLSKWKLEVAIAETGKLREKVDRKWLGI
jgi:hypothetical protein